MMDGAARLVMALARRCLLPDPGGWGRAMQAEFDAARLDGRQLGFAIGCLWAGCRRLPFHTRGRFELARHALVLGVLVPIATFHLGCAASAGRFMLTGSDPYYAKLVAKGGSARVLADTYQATAPTFLATLFLLGAIHLALAWSVLDGRWRRASILWLTAALVAAFVICAIVAVAPSVPGIAVQLAALAVELIALPLFAAWQRRNRRLFRHMEV